MAPFLLTSSAMADEVLAAELRELQLDYLLDTREKVQLMRDHGRRLSARKQFKNSFPLLLFLSHQLKGSGGSLGFPEISALAARMNQELNNFLDTDSDPRVSPHQLSAAVQQIAEELESAISAGEARVAQ